MKIFSPLEQFEILPLFIIKLGLLDISITNQTILLILTYFFFNVIFFIASMNLIGLTPYSFIVTSHFVVTLAISLSIFIGINIICIKTHKLAFFSLFLIGGILLLFIPVLQFSFFVIFFVLIKYVGVIKFRKELKSLYEYIICSANFLAVSDSTLDGLSNTVFGVGLACGPVIAIGCIAAYSYMFPSVGPLGNQHSIIIDGSTTTVVDGYINRMDEYPYSLHVDQKARVAEVFSNSDMATKDVYSKLLEISNSIANLHGWLVSPDVELHYPSYDPNLFSEFQHVLKDIIPGIQNVLHQSLGIMSSLVNHFYFVAAQVQISEQAITVVQDIVVTGDVAMWQQFLPHCLLFGLSLVLVTFFFPLDPVVFAKFNGPLDLGDISDNSLFLYAYFVCIWIFVLGFLFILLKDEQGNFFSNRENLIQKTSQIFNPINQEILTLIDIFNKYYYLSYTILNGYKKHLNFIKYMLINSCIYKFLNKNKTYNFLLLKKSKIMQKCSQNKRKNTSNFFKNIHK